MPGTTGVGNFTCSCAPDKDAGATGPASASLQLLAGQIEMGGTTDGIGTEARFGAPAGIAIDRAGNVYVADFGNFTVRKVTPDGVVTTLAGVPGVPGPDDTPGDPAAISPRDVAVDAAGNVYIADMEFVIRKVTPEGVMTTLAGDVGLSGSTDGTGSAARFLDPEALAVDYAGNVYVADTANDTIRKVTPEGVVTTLAGSAGQTGSADGTGSAARFLNPYGIAVDCVGNVFVSDSLNRTIRLVTPDGAVTTLAGSPGQQGTADGTGSAARFYSPGQLIVDSADNVYAMDSSEVGAIRKVTPEGVVTTVFVLAELPGVSLPSVNMLSLESPDFYGLAGAPSGQLVTSVDDCILLVNW